MDELIPTRGPSPLVPSRVHHDRKSSHEQSQRRPTIGFPFRKGASGLERRLTTEFDETRPDVVICGAYCL